MPINRRIVEHKLQERHVLISSQNLSYAVQYPVLGLNYCGQWLGLRGVGSDATEFSERLR